MFTLTFPMLKSVLFLPPSLPPSLSPSLTHPCLGQLRRNLKALRTCEIVDDLATLEYIDEVCTYFIPSQTWLHPSLCFLPQSVIVSQLCKRYQKRLVYTYVGDILVSINPFQKLDIYSEKVRERSLMIHDG